MGNTTWTVDAAGQWALDRSHVPGGATPIIQEIVLRAMPAGLRRVFAELGIPADTLDVRFVNGWMYTRLRPLIGPDRASPKLPPRPLLKLASRLHPEMRRRAKAAATSFDAEPWVRVIHDWQHGGRAAIESRNLAIQDVVLTTSTLR